jgi:phosphoglycolate phosphatase
VSTTLRAYYNNKSMGKEKFAAVRALVFDLDGTLIDSKLDIVNAVNAMLRDIGRPALPVDTVASYVGHGAPRLVASALGPESSEAERSKGLHLFLRHYEQHKLDNTRAYPGVEEGLATLAEHPMAVLTNKPTQISQEIIAGLGLKKYFRAVYGGDSFPKKPDPSGVWSVLREVEVAPAQAVMVGDSDVDIQTARNAGMLAVAVRYGFGKHDEAKGPADLYVDSLEELAFLANHRTR